MICSFDIEATGLLVKRDKVLGFSHTDDALRTRVRYWNKRTRAEAEGILGHHRNTVALFNAPFDLAFMQNEGITINCETHDVQVGCHLLGHSGKLNELAAELVGEDLSPADVLHSWIRLNKRGFKQKHGRPPHFGDVPWPIYEPYSAMDAIHTMKLFAWCIEPVMKNFGKLYKMEQDLTQILVDMRLRGVPIDVGYCRSMIKKLNVEKRALLEKWSPVNLGSPKQIGEVLFPLLGIEQKALTDSGRPATNKEAVENLIAHHPDMRDALEDVLRYRSLTKKVGSYFRNLIFHSIDGIIYPSFRQVGAKTARFASSDPNLQNQPRVGGGVRRAFVCRRGYGVWYFDYKQIELRRMAEYADDDPFIDAFRMDADPHLLTAGMIFGKKNAKKKRFPGKTTNYQMIYGSKAAGLARKLKIEVPVAQGYITGFFMGHPAIRRFRENTMTTARKNGFVEDYWGRYYYVENEEEIKDTPNWLIQGDCATILKRAMIRVSRLLRSECPDAHCLMTIHDELPVEIPLDNEEHIIYLVNAIKEIMVEPEVFQIPIPVDVEWTITNWEDKKKWKGKLVA